MTDTGVVVVEQGVGMLKKSLTRRCLAVIVPCPLQVGPHAVVLSVRPEQAVRDGSRRSREPVEKFVVKLTSVEVESTNPKVPLWTALPADIDTS
jgi:hypothetical protein